jgi:tRNA (cytosine38-C5)-methyltransferase
MDHKILAIEFFSGIGGLHYGLDYALPKSKVVAAFDMNTIANSVYHHNFGIVPIVKGIERLTNEMVEKYDANCWLLSPPCQPYTSGGNRLDDKDPRAEGLLHLINMLKNIKRVPDYIFLENVPNFEVSQSRNLLVETLYQLEYQIDEFLVSPVLLGVPNNRKRYYLAAKRGQKMNSLPTVQAIHSDFLLYTGLHQLPLRSLDKYLEPLLDIEDYLVNPNDIRKRTNFKFDVVQPQSKICSTFTKAYGSHHFFGSGPFLQTEKIDEPFDEVDNELLISLKPRFFTPSEVARLHCFPIDDGLFAFPESVPLKQRWKLLGNSLNVLVVGTILKKLIN